MVWPLWSKGHSTRQSGFLKKKKKKNQYHFLKSVREILDQETNKTEPQQCVGLNPGLGENKNKVSCVDVWRKSFPRRGHSECRGPRGRLCLAFSRNGKEPPETRGGEKVSRRVECVRSL